LFEFLKINYKEKNFLWILKYIIEKFGIALRQTFLKISLNLNRLSKQKECNKYENLLKLIVLPEMCLLLGALSVWSLIEFIEAIAISGGLNKWLHWQELMHNKFGLWVFGSDNMTTKSWTQGLVEGVRQQYNHLMSSSSAYYPHPHLIHNCTFNVAVILNKL
jgi:hypothetical protein